MRIDSNGNVGIGTTTPANALDVNGSLAIGTYAGTTVSTSSSIAVPNKIGIGTASPNFKLDIYDSSATVLRSVERLGEYSRLFTSEILNQSATDGTAALLNYQVKNTANTSQQGWLGVVSNTSGYSPSLVYGVRTGASTYAERMRIDSSGNVGIGTTAPSATLDVGGYGAAQVATSPAALLQSNTNNISGIEMRNASAEHPQNFVSQSTTTPIRTILHLTNRRTPIRELSSASRKATLPLFSITEARAELSHLEPLRVIL